MLGLDARRVRDVVFGSPLERLSRFGTFTSETGHRLPLYRAHRVLAVPRLLSPKLSTKATELDGSDAPAAHRLLDAIEGHGLVPPEADILEVGVGALPVGPALVGRVRSVVATDVAQYYPDGAPPHEERFRDTGVRFVWDDATDSTFADGSFDVITSYDVLEHITDPPAFFQEAARLLRPGGLLYTSYNPFFAINGGHSAATTYSHWGHALMTERDAERYFSAYHGGADEAMRFLRVAINRLTLADHRRLLDDAGFVVSRWEPQRVPSLASLLRDGGVLRQLRHLHPSADREDLLTRRLLTVAVRPATAPSQGTTA